MAQGRGNAGRAVVLALVLLCFLAGSELVESVVYNVGAGGGWTFNVASWPKGKRFRAGDVLVFNYNTAIHNVVAVNGAGYNGCTAPTGSKVFRSGKDRITLARGTNYFICSIPGHCEGAMKIAVTAA